MAGLSQGTVLGGYEIESPLGSGGMGVVYRARQLSLDRVVALKVVSSSLASDPTFVERFKQEAVLAASLEHPNVVPVYERGEAGGHLFIAMRLIAGDDLRTRLSRDGPLPPDHAVEIIGQIASALDAAHAAGLVHRDVKPANVLLTGDRDAPTAYLSDFGIARRRDAPTRLTATGVFVGTPGYVAPEVIRGDEAAAPADIYALGCVLFEALTASEPFARDDPTLTLAAHLTDPPPESGEFPPALNAVFSRAMSKSPYDRFATASALAGEARAALHGEGVVDASTVHAPIRSGPALAPSAVAGAVEQRSSLPPSAGPIVGRAREMGEIAELLRDPDVRLATMTGAGGIGKTRLALALAGEVGPTFPDGVFWVELATASSPLAVVSSLAATLDVREAGSTSLLEQLAERLRNRQVLLVLDNFEHVLEASTDVAALLHSCPTLTVLVTSRAPLRVSLEREYPVDPLDERSATELFATRATAVRPDFIPSPEVAQICARLDRVPLGIELCAARVKLMTPQTILERLDQRSALALLGEGPRDAPAHQRTLRATLDWSYGLLGPDERALFARLAVFTGGFTLEAAEAVCDARLEVLGTLIDDSLVRFDDGRYSMQQTITEYARELLSASDEQQLLSTRHAEWCVEFAERNIEPFLAGGDQEVAAACLAVEHDNITTALQCAHDAGSAELALRLAHALGLYRYITSTYLESGFSQLEATLAAFDAPPGPWAAAAQSAGWLAFELRDFDTARRYAEAALALRSEASSVPLVVKALNLLGVIADSEGDRAGARAHFDDALNLARDSGAQRLAMEALSNIGYSAVEDGALEEARAPLEQAHEIGRDSVDSHLSGSVALNLGLLNSLDDRPETAIGCFREALQKLAEAKSLGMTAHVCAGLALAAAQIGDHASCARLIGLTDALLEATGLTLQPVELDAFERAASMSSTTLRGDFETERARGRHIPAEQAPAYALGLAERLDAASPQGSPDTSSGPDR